MICRINSKYDVYPDRNEIFDGHNFIRVSPKHMQVLVMLINKSPATVTRDELLDSIWKDTIVVEETLTRAISELRKVFKITDSHSSIIKTIPKQGYVLNAKAAWFEQEPELETQKVKVVRSPLLYVGVFLSFIILFIAFNSPSHKMIKQNEILELSSRNENETGASLSDDNLHLLSIIKNQIRIKDLRNEKAKMYAVNGILKQVAWDGSRILYLIEDSLNEIKSMNEDGTFRQKMYQSEHEIKAFAKTKTGLILQLFEDAKNKILSLQKDDKKYLYETDAEIRSLKVYHDRPYVLLRNLNHFSIINLNEKDRILYESFNEIFDFDIVNSNAFIISKERNLSLVHENSSLERELMSNVDIYKLKLNSNKLLTFSNQIPVLDITQNGQDRFSTKRLEFYPIENPDKTQLAFISTRCGYYNIWMADLMTNSVVRKTFFKYGYIDKFTWDFDKNTIYYLQYLEKQQILKSIDLLNMDNNISIPIESKIQDLKIIDGKLAALIGNAFFELQLTDDSYEILGELKNKSVEKNSSFTTRIHEGNNDVLAVSLKDYL